MTLLDQLKMASAACADRIAAIAESVGCEAVVSVVISHPGTVEDCFVVGSHSLDELFALLAHLATTATVECDVTSTMVGPDEPGRRSKVQ